MTHCKHKASFYETKKIAFVKLDRTLISRFTRYTNLTYTQAFWRVREDYKKETKYYCSIWGINKIDKVGKPNGKCHIFTLDKSLDLIKLQIMKNYFSKNQFKIETQNYMPSYNLTLQFYRKFEKSFWILEP